MQTRSSDKNSVRLSVRPSVCIVAKGKKDLSRFLYLYERSFSLVYREEKWLVGGDPLHPKFWVNRPPLERNRRFWTDIRSYRLSGNT